MIKHVCDASTDDGEHIYAVSVGFIVYLDAANLPPVDSHEMKEIAAEHVIDIVRHGIDYDTSYFADYLIDKVELIECRSDRMPTKE